MGKQLSQWRIQVRTATRFNEASNTSWGVLNPSRFLSRQIADKQAPSRAFCFFESKRFIVDLGLKMQ